MLTRSEIGYSDRLLDGVALATLLATLANKPSVKWLLHSIVHTNPQVQRAAAQALANSSSSLQMLKELHGADALLRLMADPEADGILCAAVVDALGTLSDKQVVDVLVGCLGRTQPSVRMAAAGALAKLGEGQWQQLIMGDDEDFTRLGHRGDQRVVATLIKLLLSKTTPDPIRQEAAKAVTAIAQSLDKGVTRPPFLLDRHAADPLIGAVASPDTAEVVCLAGIAVKRCLGVPAVGQSEFAADGFQFRKLAVVGLLVAEPQMFVSSRLHQLVSVLR